MSADLALQKALRARLIAATGVINLVPASSILDTNQRPAPMPSIILGEGQSLEGDRIDRRDQRVAMDVHVWKKEPGLAGVKAVSGAIRGALHSGKFAPLDGFHFADVRVSSARFLRDPDGETAHGVVTVEAIMHEAA